MRDKDLYARILDIEAPWRVADVELNLQQGEVVVHVEHDGEALNCPECGQPARRYDTRQRRWRHLDTCQYRTILAAEMPRVQCERQGQAGRGEDRGTGGSAMIRRLSGGMVSLAAMILALVGCDEMALQTSEPADEPDAKPTEYVGTYRATAETTTVTLNVEADTFVAVALIPPSAGTALRVASVHVKSSEDGDGRSWLELAGDVNVTGSTATLTITGVSRDRVELEGAELQQYTDCEVTATAGIAFAEEAMQGIAACLSAADNAIVADDVTVVRQDPKALIKGKWRHTAPGAVVDTFDVESTQMRITLFPVFPVPKESVSVSVVLIIDYQITATQIPLVQVTDAVVSPRGVITVAEIVRHYNGTFAEQSPYYYVVDERSLVFSWGQGGYERFERVTE